MAVFDALERSSDIKDMSNEAARLRLPMVAKLQVLKVCLDMDTLIASTRRFHNTLAESSAAMSVTSCVAAQHDQTQLFHPFWSRRELAVKDLDVTALWLRRVTAWQLGRDRDPLIRSDQHYSSIWTSLQEGEFEENVRGLSYTVAMGSYYAGRWFGALQLLRLATNVGVCETVLDVLGGDGHIERVAAAATCVTELGPRCQRTTVVTNDASRHMFLTAGCWGPSTRECAEHLTRTFEPSRVDAVLFAYGTHHLTSLAEALSEAFQVLRPGGAVVVHDFMPGGKVESWFRLVVDRYGRAPHLFPHLGPLQMVEALCAVGFEDIEILEMDDPFTFTEIENASAISVAETHIKRMYALDRGFTASGSVRAATDSIFAYPEIGRMPIWRDEFVYLPRRAIVARARRPFHC